MFLTPEPSPPMSPTKARTQNAQTGDEGTNRGHRTSAQHWLWGEYTCNSSTEKKTKAGGFWERVGCGLLGIDWFSRFDRSFTEKLASWKPFPPKQVSWFSKLFYLATGMALLSNYVLSLLTLKLKHERERENCNKKYNFIFVLKRMSKISKLHVKKKNTIALFGNSVICWLRPRQSCVTAIHLYSHTDVVVSHRIKSHISCLDAMFQNVYDRCEVVTIAVKNL